MSENKKIKILTISDHPLSPSGVGIQTRHMIESLLKTGKYQFVSLGGAIKHRDYKPTKVDKWGDDWVVFPVDGYGNQEIVRSILRNDKPDILWFMTDPRFWGWMWEIENEIRGLVPMVYYHVWDNYPYPKFNRPFYLSNDVICTISKVTDDIVKTVAPEVESIHIPHSVQTDMFKKYPLQEITAAKHQSLGVESSKKFVFFWNNRNARRKQSGTLIFWFKKFLDKVGHDKAILIMHTEPKDPNGQDLEAIIHELELNEGQVLISRDKYDFKEMAMMYNVADCTINISDAEGFGLSTLESLSCETPIVVNMTGGLQEQVTDGKEWFGIGIEPASKAIIGSQQIPWIREDRLNEHQFVDALVEIYEMPKEEREELGRKGRLHVINNYNFENYGKQWDETFSHIYEKYGSWDTRKNYKSWKMIEIN